MTQEKNDQAAPELLPCPFCGAKPKTNHGGHSTFGRFWWVIWCDNCQFEMRDQEVWLKDGSGCLDPAYPPRHCFSAWNRRADLAAPSAPAEVDDGRPMNTDVFLGKLFEACDDLWERCEAINEWLHGDWPAALEYLEGEA